ncbi:MAG TPA: hypothetical protein PLV42_01700 [bacterium]|nr:hypothetical protein [bacterium]
MNGLRSAFYLLLAFLPLLAGAKEIGPNVATYRGQELKWEDGAYSYHVMFKSLLANLNTAGENNNPQADACLDSSAYTLNMLQVPIDAQVEKAFIVWTGAQPTAKMNELTDNTIRLDFTHETESAMNTGIDVVGKQSRLSDSQDFEFEAVIEDETEPARGYFTYRVDVTDFFRQIQETGRSLEISNGTVDGMSLYGIYSVSGLDCTADAAYLDNSTMVSSWSIIVVYVSEEVTPKKLYIYDGFYGYKHMNSIIDITGFEFPDKPAIRLTFNVNEGDPGLVNNGASGSDISESLQIMGDGNAFEQLFNSCNFLAQDNTTGQPFLYTEIFNSISSEYAFDPTSGESCVGGTPPNIDSSTMEYAIDVDTFFIDGAEELWANHFFKGGSKISLKIGANQDWILTNFLIMSHDTRAGNYDIPPHVDQSANEPEKGYCGCAQEPNGVCFDQEFIYVIKIQNWGDDLVSGVKVQDVLPSLVEYVPGTTQLATQITEEKPGVWIGTDWAMVPDGPGGEFPLAQPYQVAEQMNYCESSAEQCAGDHDRRMIRFKVKPKPGLPKNSVIQNTALISDPATTSKPYKTNTSVPLKLHNGSCLPSATCEQMNMDKCGGPWKTDNVVPDSDTQPDADTGTPACETSGVKIEYARGKNSPTGEIIIPSPSTGLTLGQFTVIGKTNNDTACTFNLNKVKIKFEKESSSTLTNLKLVLDANTNGKYETSETIVAETPNVDANYAMFDVPSTSRAFEENKLHYFIVVADALASGSSIQPNTTFQAIVEGPDTFVISDKAGDAAITSTGAVEFAQYMFEPDGESFIVTRGDNDPAVPSKIEEVNSYREVLQLRTKAKGRDNSLNSLTVRVTSGYVLFGEGLVKVAVVHDANGNGIADAGETVLAEGTGEKGTDEYVLTLKSPLTYAADEEKFLVIKADFDLSGEEKGRIQIKKATVKNNVQIYSLPIDSKEYTLQCDPNDPVCQEEEPVEGCQCALVESNNGGIASLLFMLMMGGMLLFVSRRVYGDK